MAISNNDDRYFTKQYVILILLNIKNETKNVSTILRIVTYSSLYAYLKHVVGNVFTIPQPTVKYSAFINYHVIHFKIEFWKDVKYKGNYQCILKTIKNLFMISEIIVSHHHTNTERPLLI
jgi:hypothetical protein